MTCLLRALVLPVNVVVALESNRWGWESNEKSPALGFGARATTPSLRCCPAWHRQHLGVDSQVGAVLADDSHRADGQQRLAAGRGDAGQGGRGNVGLPGAAG